MFLVNRSQAAGRKVSRFGQYKGYSKAIYDGYERRSQYLTLKNGTRLAYDLLLPTRDGVPANVPLPVLFKYTPYLRAFTIYDAEGEFLLGELYEVKWYQVLFDLLATSYLFRSGNHIRITVTFADADNFDTPILEPAPTVKLLRNARHATYVELPRVRRL